MALNPIVAQALASRKAPDIVGGFERGRALKTQAEEQARQTQARQLAGQVFAAQGIGGALGELGEVDANLGFQMMDVLKIPRNQPERLKKLAQDTRTAFELESGTPGRGVQFLTELKEQNNAIGIETPNIELMIKQLGDDRELGLRTLSAATSSFVKANILQPSALDIAAQKATVEGKQSEQKQVNVLRTSVEKAEKAFNDVAGAAERIKAVAVGTPAGDLALIFNFMKMVDPGSVVRESEFKTAEDAKAWLVEQESLGVSIPAPISNFIRRAEKGTLLEDAQRKDFLAQADNLLGAQRLATDDQIENIIGRGEQDGITAERFLGNKSFNSLQERRASRQAQQTAAEQASAEQTTTVTPQGAQETTTVQAGQTQEGQTATNPQTGQQLVFQNGQWRPV